MEAISDISDAALVRGCRRGDPRAFDSLMQRYQGNVYAVARRIVGNAHAAMDVTQEVFIKAYRKLDALEQPDQVRAWLLSIAYREALNTLRSPTRREQPMGDDEPPPAALSAAPDATVAVERGQLRDHLEAALSHLSPQHQTVVMMRYFDGLSLRDIAAATDLAETTVKSTLYRSLRRLRAQLETPGGLTHEL